MKNRVCLLMMVIVLGLACAMGTATAAERVRMVTTLGNIDIVLFDDVAPVTVANFLAYVKAGRYTNTFIHRSIPGFVIQGGGYYIFDNLPYHIVTFDQIVNEFHFSNLRGTIAMAKLPNQPNSATSEWFFNLGNNSANLDSQNGGFTVFGEMTAQSLAVMDTIASLTVYNATGIVGWTFTHLPLIDGRYLVIVRDIIPEDDLDADSPVDLTDAVCTLRIIAGIEGQEAPLIWDVNSDGRIGIEEVVYVLQKIGQLR